ncbi:hypothetical protein OAC51_03935 [Flavobacteriaceae bacterium]|nr:hypothetical protein [Flavobacteriaceae bacterium]
MILLIKTKILAAMYLVSANLIAPATTQNSTDTIEGQIEFWAGGIQNILNVVTGLFAIVGGFLIFLQYMQGNDQAQKNFIKFVIGLSIFGLVNLISSFFL